MTPVILEFLKSARRDVRRHLAAADLDRVTATQAASLAEAFAELERRAAATIPAHVHTALEERDPVCVVPGCDVAQGLENHHWDVPYADCGTSSLAGLARVCAYHHDLVSYSGYDIAGGPGDASSGSPPPLPWSTPASQSRTARESLGDARPFGVALCSWEPRSSTPQGRGSCRVSSPCSSWASSSWSSRGSSTSFGAARTDLGPPGRQAGADPEGAPGSGRDRPRGVPASSRPDLRPPRHSSAVTPEPCRHRRARRCADAASEDARVGTGHRLW